MNLLLTIAGIYLPSFIKTKKLKELFELTAEAFQCELPSIGKLSYKNCLKAYAEFSNTKSEEIIKSSSKINEIKKRLYKNAYELGNKLRKDFHIKSYNDAIQCSKILYKILKIDFSANTSGEVIIRSCFFSQHYSPEVCEIISSLDEGVAAGISGGSLVFKERITEGNSCCVAKLYMKENLS